MIRLIIIFCLLSFWSPIFSQGSWNIGYIEIDSIDNEDIGKIVKVDFIHNWEGEIKPSKKMIRNYIQPIDTCELNFGEKKFQFVEYRKIYVDHGAFQDQFVETIDVDENRIIRFYDATISEIKNDKIKFVFLVKEFSSNRKKEVNEESFYLKSIWIEKELLDGVMIEI